MTTETQAFQPAAPHDIAQEKIKFGEKFAYFLAAMNPLQVLALVTSFLLIFYTDIVGLNPIHVGTLFLLARIADGLSDPIMGYVIDHLPRTKFGKYRSLVIGGAIIITINFLLLWFGPLWAPSGKLAVAYITYLLLGFTFDIADIAKNSLLPVMTANPKERSSLGVFYGLASVVSGLSIAIAAPIILGAGHSSVQAYTTVILLVAGSVLLFGIVGGLGVRERVIPVEENTKHSMQEYLNLFNHKPVIANLGFGFLFSIAYYLFSSVNAFFFTYVMKDLSMLGIVSLAQLAGLIPGLFMFRFITARLGKKRAMVVTGIGMIVAFAIRWIDPTSVPLIYISIIMIGFLFGIFVPLSALIAADNIDYVEYKANYRSEAAQASVSSFISKVGNGLAGAIPGYALGWAGYVAGSQQQPASAITTITVLSVGIPVLLFVIAVLVFGLGYNLDKNLLQQVEDALSERRIAKQAQSK